MIKGLWLAAAIASLLALLVAAGLRRDAVPPGLSASYESLGGPPRTLTTVDPQPTTERVLDAWGGAPPDAFSATWRGTIYVPYDGPYTFATRADGESAVYLDGRKILENGWGQAGLTVKETVRPDSGPHNFTVNYRHNVGPIHLEVLWARGDAALEPIAPSALRLRRVSSWHFLLAEALEEAIAPLEWLAVGLAVLAIGASAARPVSRAPRLLASWGAPRELAWIVALSTLLNIVGIFWGIEGSWGVLEMTPSWVLGAIDAHFANGWYHAYPPLHFMILAAVTSPVVALERLGRVAVNDLFSIEVMLFASRLVTIVMAAGTVIAIFFCGARVFNQRAGLFAAAVFALAAPFVYFAKMANVDVPYLFWFSLSLVFYMRLLDGDATRDYMGLAVTAALAICTKDQAYGLYLGMPLVLLFSKGFNRRMLVAGAVSVVAFLIGDNVLFNFSGFVEHVRFIIGPGNTAYRVYEPTLAGHLQLLGMTLRLLEWTWGWPLFLACAGGLVLAAASPSTRRAAVWLLVPVVGYYLSFINVILYVYDRFTMPIALVLALFAGLALDRITRAGAQRAPRLAVTAIAFAYTFMYSSTVDVLMLRDSRYAVERWLATQTFPPPDDLIVSNVIPPYLPRLDGHRFGDVESTEELQIAQPKFFILNVDYMRGQAPDSPVGRMIAALEQHEIGYSLVYRARRATPWPWSWVPGGHPDLVGDRVAPVFVSNLRNINPTIEVFQHDSTIGH